MRMETRRNRIFGVRADYNMTTLVVDNRRGICYHMPRWLEKGRQIDMIRNSFNFFWWWHHGSYIRGPVVV